MEQSTEQYQSLDERPYESFYLYIEGTFDHPVDKVWPHALDIGSWMSDHRLVTLAGQPGQVGHFQRVFSRGMGPEVPLPHHHLYGLVEAIPPKMIVLEIFPEKGGSYGKARQKISFDSIILTDLGGRTHIAFHMVDVHLGRGEQDFAARRKSELEAVRGMIERYFENLRRNVAKGS